MAYPGVTARLVLSYADGERETIGLHCPAPPDISVVGMLARLQLTVRRLGGELWLEEASEPLIELLELAGLRGQMVREPEEGEQPAWFQEAVEGGDAAV
jgi:hypothetical protein